MKNCCMNLYFFIFIFIIAYLHPIRCQDTYLWNPLHLGDIWEYVDHFGDHAFKRVLKDTVIDGKTYFKVHQISDYYGTIYERVAENAVYLYDLYDWDNNPSTKELLCDSLNAPIGTKYISYRYYQAHALPQEVTIQDRYYQYMDLFKENVLITYYTRIPLPQEGTTGNITLNKPMVEEAEEWAEKYGLITMFLEGGGYFVIIAARINNITYGVLSTLNNNEKEIPDNYKLYQNYPNPFNSNTKIEFYLPKRGFYKLEIFDIHGKLIKSFKDNNQIPRKYTIIWDGKDENNCEVTSNLYFYRLTALNSQLTNKLILMK